MKNALFIVKKKWVKPSIFVLFVLAFFLFAGCGVEKDPFYPFANTKGPISLSDAEAVFGGSYLNTMYIGPVYAFKKPVTWCGVRGDVEYWNSKRHLEWHFWPKTEEERESFLTKARKSLNSNYTYSGIKMYDDETIEFYVDDLGNSVWFELWTSGRIEFICGDPNRVG